MNKYMNSTEIRSQNCSNSTSKVANVHFNSHSESSDPVSRLANILASTLTSSQNSSFVNGNTSYLSRMTSKRLPEFRGDPLDYLNFKQAYELSTELGNYTEKENVMRLFDSLKDEAREATKTLFAAGNGTREIMQTLELRFGNTNTILEKIVNNIKKLPSIESGKIDLVEFSSKLKNAVVAIKSLKDIGYLNSPQFAKETLEKIPKAMLHDYARFAAAEEKNKSPLEKIADFMFQEAKFASEAGIVNLHCSDSGKSYTSRTSHSSRVSNQKAVFTTDVMEIDQIENFNHDEIRCDHCGYKKHSIKDCRTFAREPMRERWKIARKLKLCFNCLNKGHGRDDCKEAKACNQCDKAHHTILHFVPRSEERENIRESNVRQYKSSKPSAASKTNDCNEISLNKVSNVSL